MASDNTEHIDFEPAIDAIINGDESRLIILLTKSPSLIKERSAKNHHATLLHYIAANGVENDKQKSPPNACAIAKILIDHGAEIDALADCYGGGIAQTPLSLLVSSYPPAAAGIQGELVDVFAAAGANIDGLDGNGGPLETAVSFGYTEAVDALIRNGASVHCLQVAAATGNQKILGQFFDQNGNLIAGTGKGGGVIPPTDNPVETLSSALFFACLHSRLDIANLLIDKGAELGWKGPEGFTALHGAVFRGDFNISDFLLQHGAPLEITNNYGGTPLDTLCWAAVNIGDPDIQYPVFIDLLLRSGASAKAVDPFPTGLDDVDAIISRYR